MDSQLKGGLIMIAILTALMTLGSGFSMKAEKVEKVEKFRNVRKGSGR